MNNKSDYDVIIIGGGIGGLVCGCYLAKAGKKVLIVEKNIKVGGYCTSFTSNGFQYDAFAHSLGSCGKNGKLSSILNDLNIGNELTFFESSPARVVISKDKKFEIYNDAQVTLQNLSSYFPRERNGLKKFFKVIERLDYLKLVIELRKYTFENFFKTYVDNTVLHNLFSFLLFQASGLPGSLISALLGVILLKDYILAGGYYPMGGMQRFSEVLSSSFTKFGGTVLCNSEVKQIILGKSPLIKIDLSSNESREIRASMIISNADPVHTLRDLLGINDTDDRLKMFLRMKPSLSCVAVYLKLRKSPLEHPYVQFVDLDKDVEKHIYRPFWDNNFANIYLDYFFNKFSDSGCVTLSLLAPFNNKKFWLENGGNIAKKLISEFVIKTGLALSDVEIKGMMTPINLSNWTYAYKGASFGWAPTMSQVFPNFRFPINLPKLHFIGQWVGMGHGISTVAYLGRYLAKLLLNPNNLKDGIQRISPWVLANNC